MFSKFSRAYSLVGPCWRVLMLDKELLLFPIMSAIALATVLGATVYPLYASGALEMLVNDLQTEQGAEQHLLYLAVGLGFYFVCYFVIIFFNAALIGCALIRFGGGDPTVADGFRLSLRNLPQITLWALVMATVGFLLQLLESRFRGLARFLVGFIGAAWSVATFFAVPILVVDGVGPVDAVKRSVAAIRKTWGEALVSHVGFGLLGGLATLIMLPLFAGAVWIAPTSSTMAIGLVFVALVWILLVNLILTTLSAIMRAALYIYAVEGEIPAHFDSQLMRDAFGAT